MSIERNVAVVTPWYPDAQRPYRGSFVQAMAAAVAPGLDRLDIYHLDGWAVSPEPARLRRVRDLHTQLLPRAMKAAEAVGGASLYRFPAIVERSRDHAVHARRYAEWLGVALDGRRIEADVIHAHVPMLGGYAALEHCRSGAKVYTTEHSSFLPEVLSQASSRELYDEILHRSAGSFVVGAPLHDLIAEVFPHHAAKIQYIANPIDFTAGREQAPRDLRRWLSVAGLVERKRIDYLLQAFAECHAEDGTLTLTLAGEGVLRAALVKLAEELGISEAVSFIGSVDPGDIPALMADHDLLVHTSRHETFGVVVVEAIAAGIPVLVTRSGGSDQVLAGIEEDAGRLVDVVDDPGAFADAFRDLRERHPGKTDLGRAREHLRAKYSYEAVADHHHRIWFGAAA
ncbi:glycosyltransferase [Glycomyces algeriensis]|uniref:Glycosyl transferase n=1 Tax=Glycomyces algeriensis TaxID=256037 RepID=A0A9W6G5X8_9ACTN|nr:glycosyltransferase [Glycomyces algeriensis]MDA1366201.1 glycosyltransferase [Glycomyces algeriensis]MDR7349031.1 glycogen(starch) synthase [Glycomyces algeriensis]GLI41734.1 glycosyl transferase [Glycomyces algeriensis]